MADRYNIPSEYRTDKDNIYGQADYLDRNLPSKETLNAVQDALDALKQAEEDEKRIEALESAVVEITNIVVSGYKKDGE